MSANYDPATLKALDSNEALIPRICQGWPQLIDEAVTAAQQNGFKGRYVRTIADFEHRYHALAIIECEFETHEDWYVVVSDSHVGGDSARLHRFTEVVHFLQNTTERNFWETATRKPAQ